MAFRPPVPPYNMRIRGSDPSVEVDDSNLRLLLGIGGPHSNMSLQVTADCAAHGIIFSATDEHLCALTAPEPFLSLRTAADVERLRIDSNGVSCGVLTANLFTNLIDDHETPDVYLPPTANALYQSFVTLSNLILTTAIGQQSGGGGSVLPYNNATLALVDNYKSTSILAAPTANALRASYYSLSNLLTLRLRSITATTPSSSNVVPTSGFQLTNDEWLMSTDGQPRFRFDKDGATTFAANGYDSVPMFQWFYNDLQQNIMTLSSTGDLTTLGGLSVAGGNATFAHDVNISGNLNVTKVTYIHSNVTIFASEEVRSNLDVDGAGVFHANMTVYGPTFLSNAAFVSSNLSVQGVAVLSNDATVYGITTLSNAAFVSSNLSVQGAAMLSNDATVYGITTLSNAAFVSSNLSVQGAAVLSNNATVYGITTLSNAAFVSSNLSVQGAVNMWNDVAVHGMATVSNALLVTGNIDVYGAGTFYGITTVSNAAHIVGNLSVFGPTVLSNDTTIYGSATVSNQMVVAGPSYLYGDATMYGFTTISNAIVVSSNLSVQGAAILSDDLAVHGIATFSNAVYMSSNADVAAQLRVGGQLHAGDDALFSSNITVMGSINALSYTYAHSNVTIYNSEHVHSNLVVDGDFTLMNTATFNGTVSMSNALIVSSNIVARGDCIVGSNVTVAGYLSVGINMFTHDGSNLGINLDPGDVPTCALHVNGAVYSTEQLFALSDRTVKDDIKPITKALDKLNHITGCTYVRIDDATGTRHVGVIAQDVNEAVPEAVQVGRDGKMSVSYGSLVAVTIEGIKELQRMQETMRTGLCAMSATISHAAMRTHNCRRRSIRIAMRPKTKELPPPKCESFTRTK